MWYAFRLPRSLLHSQRILTSPKFSLVAAGALTMYSATSRCEENEKKQIALHPDKFRPFRVRSIEPVTHNVQRIIFDLPSESHEMGMTVASCLLARAKVDGKNVIRAYTPVTLNEEKGFLELVVKGYPNGKLSKHIVSLEVGDVLELKGPKKKFEYKANMYKKIGLIAGGSGLTPMLQIAKQICRDTEDDTQVTLLFANSTEEDIILRDELDAMQALYPQLKVHHVISRPSENWKGRSGTINKKILEELMPSADEEDILICVCGPEGMMYHICGNKAKDATQGELQGLLKEMNYTSRNVFKF